MHFNKRFFVTLSVSLIVGFFSTGIAQKRTHSPYSRYGIGEVSRGGFGRNQAMGYTGIALESQYGLNNSNPASYCGIDSTSFFFESGISGYTQTFDDGSQSQTFNNMNFDYFAIGFSAGKHAAMTLGLQPLSSTDYNYSSDNGNNTYSVAFGNGSISKAYGGLSISPINNLRVGAHLSYIFGSLENFNFTSFTDVTGDNIGRKRTFQVNDLMYDLGVQYSINLSDKKQLLFGATFTPSNNINGKSSNIVARSTQTPSDKFFDYITSDDIITSEEGVSSNSFFKLPSSIGIGVAYQLKDKLTLTADFKQSNWKDITIPDANIETKNSSNISAGIEYIPNERSPDSYLKRVHYRVGGFLNKDYLVLNDYQLEHSGITFGVGLPLKRSLSIINIGMEIGQRGTTDHNLIKETYSKFFLNLTMNEFWFRKRKFD